MNDDEAIVKALEQERDDIRKKIIHLEGVHELANSDTAKSKLKVEIETNKEKLSQLSRLISEHSE